MSSLSVFLTLCTLVDVPDVSHSEIYIRLERARAQRREKKDALAECFTFFAGALNAATTAAVGGRGVNALLLAHDKIKGTKGNWARGEVAE